MNARFEAELPANKLIFCHCTSAFLPEFNRSLRERDWSTLHTLQTETKNNFRYQNPSMLHMHAEYVLASVRVVIRFVYLPKLVFQPPARLYGFTINP